MVLTSDCVTMVIVIMIKIRIIISIFAVVK